MILEKIKKIIIKFYLHRYVDRLDNNLTITSSNQKSKFYIISSKKKRGFFSILLFVLNHLKYCEKKKLIPIIDMKYHKTLYNEKNLLFGTYNSWEYFFKKINNYEIKNIYKLRKFKICKDENIYTKNNEFNKNLRITFEKYIKINKRILKKYNFFKKKFFSKEHKILGVHFRGTDMRYTPNHPLPMTKNQVLFYIKNIMNKNNIKKIFLATEDEENFKFIISEFGKKNVLHINNFRSNKTKVFNLKVRKNHRYKLGEESLINGLCLSNCNFLLSSQTGLFDFAKFINPKIKFLKIDNGFSSKKISVIIFKFYLNNLISSVSKIFK